MNVFPSLFANERLKNSLGRDFISGRFSHAYIIEGKDGFGKMTAALSCAAAISCENKLSNGDVPCGKCISCKKIFGKISGDVVVINSGDKKTIGVDTIREMRNGLYITPNDGEYRVYIIENAEAMTVQAQNALLISLEEPPSYVVFLILCEDSSKMLETIRSRAPIIRMEYLGQDRIIDFLGKTDEGQKLLSKDEEKIKRVSVMCDGSAGKALEMCADALKASKKTSAEDVLRDIAEKLVRDILTGKKANAIELVRTIPKGHENSRAVVDFGMKAIRDLIAKKIGSEVSPAFYANAEEIALLSKTASLQRLNKIYSAFAEYRSYLEQNASEAIITTLLAIV